ncbi:MAG: TolC family protein [Oscillospiraceae bacterium]|nr:TolC family protein [Oscillospiraceae bacterium]
MAILKGKLRSFALAAVSAAILIGLTSAPLAEPGYGPVTDGDAAIHDGAPDGAPEGAYPDGGPTDGSEGAPDTGMAWQEKYAVSELTAVALKNTRQRTLDGMDMAAKRRAYDRAVRDSVIYSWSTFPERAMQNYQKSTMGPALAKLSLEMSVLAAEGNRQRLAISVESLCYGLLGLEKELSKERQSIANSRRLFDIQTSRYNLGLITENDYSDSQFDMQNKEDGLIPIQDRIDASIKGIFKAIGEAYDPGLPFALDLSLRLEDVGFTHDDLGWVTEEALRRDPTHYSKVETLAIREAWFEELSKYYGEETDEYSDGADLMFELRLDLELYRAQVAQNVEEAYFRVLNGHDNVRYNDRNVALKKRAFNLANERFALGRTTLDNVIRADEAYLQARMSNYNSVGSYMAEKRAFLSMFSGETVESVLSAYWD